MRTLTVCGVITYAAASSESSWLAFSFVVVSFSILLSFQFINYSHIFIIDYMDCI